MVYKPTAPTSTNRASKSSGGRPAISTQARPIPQDQFVESVHAISDSRVRIKLLQLLSSAPKSSTNDFNNALRLMYQSTHEGINFCEIGYRLLEFMKAQRVQRDTFTYTFLLNICIKSKRIDVAFQTLKDMRTDNCVPSVMTLNSLLNVCGHENAGSVGMCLELLSIMKRFNIKPTVVTCSSLINIFAKRDDIDTAFLILDLMGRENVPPNLITFNTLINACAHKLKKLVSTGNQQSPGFSKHQETSHDLLHGTNSQDSVKHYLDKAFGILGMMELQNISPATDTINSLLKLCSIVGDSEKAFEVLKIMHERKIKPDILTYSSVLKALTNSCSSDSSQVLETGFEILGSLNCQGVKPNVIFFNHLISLCLKHNDVTRALEVLDAMPQYRVVPDMVSYSSFIPFLNCKEMTVALFKLMRKNNFVNLVAYNSFIKKLGSISPDAAMYLFDAMHEDKIAPDAYTFNTLIDTCLTHRHVERAFKVLEIMKGQYGIRPSVYTYSCFINSLTEIGDEENLKLVIERMDKEGVKFNATALSAYLKNFKSDFGKAMQEARKISEQHRIPPSLIVFNVLMDVCSRHGLVDEAFSLFDDLKRDKLQPDLVSYTSLIDACAHSGHLEKAVQTFETMQRDSKELQPDVVIYTALINACVLSKSSQKVERGFEFYEQMKARRVVPNITTYSYLIKLCGTMDGSSSSSSNSHSIDRIRSLLMEIEREDKKMFEKVSLLLQQQNAIRGKEEEKKEKKKEEKTEETPSSPGGH